MRPRKYTEADVRADELAETREKIAEVKEQLASIKEKYISGCEKLGINPEIEREPPKKKAVRPRDSEVTADNVGGCY